MVIKALVSGGILALLAGSAMAQSLDPVRVETFRSILQGNNCVLNETAASNILPRFDFTREETRAIVGALVAAGEVRLDGSTLNLIDGSCASDDPVAGLLERRDVQRFIAVMAEHNCAMTESEGERVFTALGLDKQHIGDIISPMMQFGMASFDNSTSVLSVDSAYCSPVAEVAEADSPVPDSPASDTLAPATAELDRSGMFGLSRVRALVDAMAENGCGLNIEAADPYLADTGVSFAMARVLGRRMLSDGNAEMSADGQTIVLSAPYCIPVGGVVSPDVVLEPDTSVVEETPAAVPQDAPAIAENGGSLEDIFLSVMSENGCQLSETDAREILPAAGIRMDQGYRVAEALVEQGIASYSDDGAVLTISSDRCAQSDGPAAPAEPQPVAPEPQANVDVAPAPAPQPVPAAQPDSSDPRAGLLAMLAANNCEVTQGNVADLLAEAGLDYTSSLQMLTAMMNAGEATSPDGGQTLQVGPPLCSPTVAAVPQTPREILINLIRQNNCSITAAEFNTLLPVDGLDANTAFGLIGELEAEGVISLPATRDIVTLSAENCR